jgi:hypothetical protein
MIDSWLEDGRKIPGLVMNYIRKIAVRAVEEKGYIDMEVDIRTPAIN